VSGAAGAVSDRPPFRRALGYWARLGCISFGGPAGQIAIMHRDLVERKRWIDEPRFLHALNFCMLLPGPEAQQLATYVGWLLHGVRGALAAGILFVLPSVAVLWALAAIYAAWGAVPAVAGVLSGIKPVVVAIVVEAVVRIGRRAFRHPLHLGFAAAAFAALAVLHAPFPLVVALAALGGAVAGRRVPRFAPRADATSDADLADADRSRRTFARATLQLAVFALLWLAPFAVVSLFAGSLPVLREIDLFFTGAALVTFGGAYAVLAYVAQVAVERLAWLSHAQMIDALALAETTPGPLIMVTQFVGFLAGWNHPGALAPLAAATLGALLTTWVTFLPCFAFVLLGAPHVERLRGRAGLAAALAGVTAAAVGVILNLALLFGRATLVAGGKLDLWACGLAIAALGLLVRLRWEAHWVVIAGALAGFARVALG